MKIHRLVAVETGMLNASTQEDSKGIAQLELAIVLAILVPLMVAMAVVWLPGFAKRSSDLNNALAALGACLVDPINLYEMQAGQLVVREDLQSIVNSVISNCSVNSGGAEACAMVFQGGSEPVTQSGTTPETCAKVDISACTSGPFPPPGLMIFLLLPDGSQECDHVPGNDSSSQSIGGDYPGSSSTSSSSSGSSSGGGSNLGPCPPLIAPADVFYAAKCLDDTPLSGVSTYTCCEVGTTLDSDGVCRGCPTGKHACGTAGNGETICSPDGGRFHDSGCCSAQSGNYGCTTNENFCAYGATTPCCPKEILVEGVPTPVSCSAHQSMPTPFSLCMPVVTGMDCQCVQGLGDYYYIPYCHSTRKGTTTGVTCPVDPGDEGGNEDPNPPPSNGGPMDDSRIGGSC